MSERTDHTRKVFAWLNQIKGDGDATAFMVAYEIAQHVDHQTGEAFAGAPRLAKKLGLSLSTVQEAIDRLEACGHLAVERGKKGRGHSNRYRMIIKYRLAGTLEGGKCRSAGISKDNKIPADAQENTGLHEIKYRPAGKNNREEQLREDPLRESAPSARSSPPPPAERNSYIEEARRADVEYGLAHGLSSEAIAREAEKFREYKPPPKKPKPSFRTWLIRAVEYAQRQPSTRLEGVGLTGFMTGLDAALAKREAGS